MKVWILYDNPFDEGWNNVYGVFSSREKLDLAIEKFAPIATYELFCESFEVDALEKFFDVSKPKVYSGYCPVYRPVLNEETIKYIEWQSIHESGLDTFLNDEPRKDTLLLTNALWLSVSASSKEEAIQKGNEMLKELINQPEDERGWKYLEKEIE